MKNTVKTMRDEIKAVQEALDKELSAQGDKGEAAEAEESLPVVSGKDAAPPSPVRSFGRAGGFFVVPSATRRSSGRWLRARTCHFGRRRLRSRPSSVPSAS